MSAQNELNILFEFVFDIPRFKSIEPVEWVVRESYFKGWAQRVKFFDCSIEAKPTYP
jgi:hypothetical protein